MNTQILDAIQQNKCVLLADGGSTKMEWLLVRGNNVLWRRTEIGVNPTTSGLSALKNIFATIQQCVPMKPDAVGYYGAGCVPDIIPAIVQHAENIFSCQAECGSDLLLAARLLCGNADGLVCILGTGSNSAYFSKGEIIEHVPSLGYLLGDEGGAVDMGKRIIRACLRRQADTAALRQWDSMNIDMNDILTRCYHGVQSPAAFIGSITQRMAPALTNSTFIQTTVRQSLEAFFNVAVDAYHLQAGTNLYFTGSVAAVFANILEDLAAQRNLCIATVVQRPFDKLTHENQQ